MIDDETKQKIFDATTIYDVVSDFVNLTKRGANYVGLCPFHNEKTGSFTVSPSKNIFKCFGCGESGGPVQFIMLHEKLTYPEALRYLAKKYHIDVVEKQLTPEEIAVQSKEEAMYAVNDWAQKYFEDQLYNTPSGKSLGYSYFVERGFSENTMKKFCLGYCQDEYHTLFDAAKKKGFKEEHLLATGLVTKNDKGYYADKFRGRVIFPIFSVSGRVVGFGGRILGAKTAQSAKYLNSPESEIYQKRKILYGLYHAKNAICKYDCCYLVEGYTDVISMHQSGIENVVASSGTSLTEEQIRAIRRFTKNITVLYDGDFAGIKASIRGIDMLIKEDMNVKVLLLPDGEDPDSFARSHNAVDFVNFINENQENFIRFKIKILLNDVHNDPHKRAEAINNIVETISFISDIVTREVYIQEAATLLDVDERVLVRQVAQMRKKHFEEEQKKASINNARYNSESMPDNSGIIPVMDNQNDTDNHSKPNTPIIDSISPSNSRISTSKSDLPKDKYFCAERNIIHYLICYPKYPMVDADSNAVILYDNVISALSDVARDNKIFTYDVFNDILSTIGANMLNVNEKDIQQLLLNSENPLIAKIAGDCIMLEEDKLARELKAYPYEGKDPNYEKQHIEEVKDIFFGRVVDNVSDVINEYKSLIVKDKIKILEKDFSDAFNAGDLSKAEQIKSDMNYYNDIISFLSHSEDE